MGGDILSSSCPFSVLQNPLARGDILLWVPALQAGNFISLPGMLCVASDLAQTPKEKCSLQGCRLTMTKTQVLLALLLPGLKYLRASSLK